jgi:O-antigen/teichoic acid export membrane protein
MSDSPGPKPPLDGGPTREGEDADFPDPPAETAGRGTPPRPDLTVLFNWASRQAGRAFRWLDETFSRKSDGDDPFHLKSVPLVLDRLAGIAAGLIGMVVVDRYYGPAGLGVFAWFFSLLALAGYLGRYGIPVFVENRIARSPESVNQTAADALTALVALGLAAVVLCGAAYSIAGPGERVLYLLLGPTILFQNINAWRLAILNGTGRHRTAAGLKMRQRAIFLAATLALCMADVPVALLAGAFLVSQMAMVAVGRKAVKLPAISAMLAGRKHISGTMDNGRAFLFTDNLLDVVFYLDMLILGWFVDPMELGIYARALILARLFLVIPAGIRPVFRRIANQRVSERGRDRLLPTMARTTRSLFFVHGLLAVLVLVYFPRVMTLVFGLQQWVGESFTVFALVVPGLIFFSAVTALEPVFEARQQSGRLKRMTLVVAIANLVLNINLIPFAGLEGAAMATAGAMLIHFFLFFRLLPPDLRAVRISWPGAAASLYLTYALTAYTAMGICFSLMVVPIVFGAVLWMVGFFNPLPVTIRMDPRAASFS